MCALAKVYFEKYIFEEEIKLHEEEIKYRNFSIYYTVQI